MDLNLQDFICKLKANHRAKQELSPYVRVAICSLVAAGYTKQSLATLFGISRHAIRNTIERWDSHNTFDSRPRSGRPEALTPSEKRYILLMVKKDRRLARKALINAVGKKVSPSTIRRCLRAYHLRKWRAKKRIPLTKELAKDRYNFACNWLEKTDELVQVSCI